MGDYKLQYKSEKEECTICFDEANEKWVKVIIEDVTVFPEDVEEQMQKDKEISKFLLEALSHK
jgi:hypothetical protein